MGKRKNKQDGENKMDTFAGLIKQFDKCSQSVTSTELLSSFMAAVDGKDGWLKNNCGVSQDAITFARKGKDVSDIVSENSIRALVNGARQFIRS